MNQKYKIFIGNNWLSIDEKGDKSADRFSDENQIGHTEILDELSHLIQGNRMDSNWSIRVRDAQSTIKNIESNQRLILACGGYVLNARNELLMILRRGHWDLPKGKIESGETVEECAVREVEEECGVSELSIESRSFVTYHVYSDEQGAVLKKSIWFKMRTSQSAAPVPQIEEEITEVRWQAMPIPENMMDQMYLSIVDVIRFFG